MKSKWKRKKEKHKKSKKQRRRETNPTEENKGKEKEEKKEGGSREELHERGETALRIYRNREEKQDLQETDRFESEREEATQDKKACSFGKVGTKI